MSTIDTPTSTTPTTVTASYWLYIVGAVLGLIGALVLIITIPAQVAIAQDSLTRSLQGRSTNGVDVSTLANAAVVSGVVIGSIVTLVFSVLTILFAQKYRRGRNWARIVLAVFAGLQIFGAFNINTFGVSSIHFVVVLVALILSFLPASNAWFRAMKPAAAPTV
jgi:hypothetical protein